MQGIEKAGTFKKERIITSPMRGRIAIGGQEVRLLHLAVYSRYSDGQVVSLCANNYLGLSAHEELVKAAKDTLSTHGLGLSSVRFICGTQDIHKTLEKKIAGTSVLQVSRTSAKCLCRFPQNGRHNPLPIVFRCERGAFRSPTE